MERDRDIFHVSFSAYMATDSIGYDSILVPLLGLNCLLKSPSEHIARMGIKTSIYEWGKNQSILCPWLLYPGLG